MSGLGRVALVGRPVVSAAPLASTKLVAATGKAARHGWLFYGRLPGRGRVCPTDLRTAMRAAPVAGLRASARNRRSAIRTERSATRESIGMPTGL